MKYHDISGHFSEERTVRKIQEKYYFPKMRRYLRFHINSCPECLLFKLPRGKNSGGLNLITPGKRPFEVVNVDHIGPFITSTRGNNHVIVIINNLTKFVKIYAVKNTSTKAFISCFERFVLDHGLPKRLISDRRTCFTSRAFAEYCSFTGIQHSLISVRHPQSNRQVERVNAVIVPLIQVNMSNPTIWERELQKVESELNNTYNKTIGDILFHVLFGYYSTIQGGALASVTKSGQTW